MVNTNTKKIARHKIREQVYIASCMSGSELVTVEEETSVRQFMLLDTYLIILSGLICIIDK